MPDPIDNTTDHNLSDAKRELLERRLRGRAPSVDGRGTTRIDGSEPAELSHGQRRLWVLNELYPANPAYHVHEVVQIDGLLDRAVFTQAFNLVVERHDILRSVFTSVDGQPSREVRSPAPIDIPFEDLSDAGDPDDAVEKIAVECVRRPFDLAEGPLIRAWLFKLGSTCHHVVLSIHHIIIDEWSLDVFWQELGHAYRAAADGRPPELPAVRLQYADFVHWQRSRLKAQILESDLDYWKRQLSGLEPVTLRFERARPQVESLRGASFDRPLPTDLADRLKRLARDSDTTPFVVFLTAFYVLLHRYTGQSDLAVGCPFSDRGHRETRDLIGFLLNTLVLRVDLSGNPTFREAVSRVRRVTLDGLAHMRVPFDRIVDEIRPRRASGTNPLFQLMFVLQRQSPREPLGPGLTVERIRIDPGVSKFDLTLFIAEVEGGFTLAVEYSTELYEAATMRRLLHHLEVVLQGAVASPSVLLSDLSIMPEHERRDLLGEWSGLPTAEPPDLTIHELIEARADENPSGPAVIFEEEVLTYGELIDRSNTIARQLRIRGVACNVPVGLCVERSLEMIIGILGILKAGGAYVPLDPTYPTERLQFMLEDAGASILLAAGALPGDLDVAGLDVLDINQVLTEPATESDQSLDGVASCAPDLAYIVYTSGTTGRPKGVAVTHRNLVSSTLARFEFYPAAVGKFLLLSSFSFDSSAVGIFWTLTTGGTLVLPRIRQEQDLVGLGDLIAGQEVTHTLCLPSLYGLLLANVDVARLATLSTVIVAGETCRPDLVDNHFELRPDGELYNEYGPTEATVWCTAHRIEQDDATGPVPIGRPVNNSRVYLLDVFEQPVPAGVPGELYVGGHGVANGYHNRPDLTTERFVENPFSDSPDDRLYRTGDLARFRDDGTIEFLGRVDQQVKIRGYRIEPAGVEEILRLHPEIHEAAVTAVSANGRGRLAAFVVTADGNEPSQWQAHLKRSLPEYMIPARLTTLDRLPRQPNGKIDVTALLEQNVESSHNRDLLAKPRTDAERSLVSIWSDVLGVDEIGIHDNFFDIGGDSILSIQIVARAAKAGLAIGPNDLFENQTVAELAAVVGDESERITSADADPRDYDIPLSSTQQALLLATLRERDSNLALLQVCCTFHDSFDEEAFETAWHDVVHHHAVFRTELRWHDLAAPSQHVHGHVDLEVEYHDWRAQVDNDQDERLEEFLARDRDRGIDLASAPVMRVSVIRINDRTTHFVWASHHLILDGWSWALAFSGFFDRYFSIRDGRRFDAKPEPAFSRYLDWVERRDQSDAEAFWRRTVRGISTPTQLGRSVRAEGAGQAFGKQAVSLGEQQADKLRDFARRNRLTLNTLVQAAWALVLHRISGDEDVVFGATVSGRATGPPDIDSMLGVFSNTVPARVQLPASMSVISWLKEVQQGAQAARAYSFVPLDQIQSWSDVPGHSRLFDSIVVFQNYQTGTFAGENDGRLSVRIVEDGLPSNHALSLFVVPEEEITLHLLHDKNRFDGASVACFVEAVRQTLNLLADEAQAQTVGSVAAQVTLDVDLIAESAGGDQAAAAAIDPPRDQIELELTRIWEDLLGIRDLGIRTSFFDLGGHSLLAARLFAEIEDALDRRLPLTTLLDHPTIEGLAGAIRDRKSPERWSALVPVRSGRETPPLFFVHAGGGNVLFYREIWESLPAGRPVYGLQALGLDGAEPPLTDFQEMASRYVGEILSVHPTGPYVLVGRCAGNGIGLEVARLLWDAGERDVELIILDSAHLTPAARQSRQSSLARRLRSRLLRLPGRVQRRRNRRHSDEQTRILQKVQDATAKAEGRYRPELYGGPITLIRSSDFASRRDKDFHTSEWSRLAGGGLDVRIIETNHLDIFDQPAAGLVADEIVSRIESTGMNDS